MTTQKKTRLERIMNRCAHFSGIQHAACDAGIAYDSFRQSDGRLLLPCFADEGADRPCEPRRFPTAEEATREAAEEDAVYARVSKAHRAAHDDAKAHGFGKGRGGRGAIQCPICEKRLLRYTVAAYNGHMHARCDTDGCVSWME